MQFSICLHSTRYYNMSFRVASVICKQFTSYSATILNRGNPIPSIIRTSIQRHKFISYSLCMYGEKYNMQRIFVCMRSMCCALYTHAHIAL